MTRSFVNDFQHWAEIVAVANAVTLALRILHSWFEPGRAGAGSHGDHPLAVPIAVELQWHRDLQRVGDARPRSDDQGRCLGAGGRLGENGEVGDGGGALLVEDPDRDERHARAKVLKGQVEPRFGQGAEASDFRIHAPRLEDGEAGVRGDGVHLHVGVLHPEGAGGGGRVGVGLVVEEVECLFAGARDVWNAVAVSHCEFHFHINAQHILPWDKVTA